MLLHRFLVFTFFICAAMAVMGQQSNVETLHAVTLRVDTVDTPAEADEVGKLIHSALAIRDFDAKMDQGSTTLKVNYTFLDAPAQQELARQRLEAAGYVVRDIGGVRQMTVTSFPGRKHHTEDEPDYHPADTDKNGEVTEQEYLH